MDREAWYSVTPEGIARHLARFMHEKCPGTTIVDAFCGVSPPNKDELTEGGKQFHSIRSIIRSRFENQGSSF
jgi:hypothetical protein